LRRTSQSNFGLSAAAGWLRLADVEFYAIKEFVTDNIEDFAHVNIPVVVFE
jgi:hypothetical protein